MPTYKIKTVFILIFDHLTILCIYHASFASFSHVRVYLRYSKWNLLSLPIQKLLRKHSQKYIHNFYISTFASETRNTDVFNFIPKQIFTKECWNLINDDVSIRMQNQNLSDWGERECTWIHIAVLHVIVQMIIDRYNVLYTMTHVQSLILCWSRDTVIRGLLMYNMKSTIALLFIFNDTNMFNKAYQNHIDIITLENTLSIAWNSELLPFLNFNILYVNLF